MNYKESYKLSLEQPEEYWGKAADDIHWDKTWNRVLDDSNIPFIVGLLVVN